MHLDVLCVKTHLVYILRLPVACSELIKPHPAAAAEDPRDAGGKTD